MTPFQRRARTYGNVRYKDPRTVRYENEIAAARRRKVVKVIERILFVALVVVVLVGASVPWWGPSVYQWLHEPGAAAAPFDLADTL